MGARLGPDFVVEGALGRREGGKENSRPQRAVFFLFLLKGAVKFRQVGVGLRISMMTWHTLSGGKIRKPRIQTSAK